MTFSKLWTPAVLTFAVVVAGAVAQDPARPAGDRPQGDQPPPPPEDDGGPPPPPFGPPPNPLLIAMDTDNDGELSAEEIKKAPETLTKLDRNKDGRLSEIEFRPPPPPGQGRPGMAGGPGAGPAAFIQSVLRYDTDKDGKVSAKELPERMRRLLEEGDTNDDGTLDRAELGRMARTVNNARPGRPPGPGGPPPRDEE